MFLFSSKTLLMQNSLYGLVAIERLEKAGINQIGAIHRGFSALSMESASKPSDVACPNGIKTTSP